MEQVTANSGPDLHIPAAFIDLGTIQTIGILAVQAVFEMLYVRKVLLMGGSGVPLMPY